MDRHQHNGRRKFRHAAIRHHPPAAGDTIQFDPAAFPSTALHTITLASGQLEIGHNLTIAGPGPAALTISGNSASRVFQIDPNVSATLSGLTIAGGNAGSNGGGGIYNNAGTLNLSNATVSGNIARLGGGVYTLQGTTNVSNSTFNNDTASNYGGGFDCDSGTTATVTACTLNNNTAPNGGGILDYGITLTISNSTLTANSATNGPGGGISNVQGALTATNCTIDANSSSQAGGGIYNGTGAVTLNNTIVADDTYIGSTTTPNDISGTVSGSYNLVGDGSGGLSTANHNILGTPGSPQSPALDPLGYYGGPTATMPPGLAQTWAVDRGSNALIPAGIKTDQRGFARIVNGTVDIGACEFGATPPSNTLTINGTSGADVIVVGATPAGGIRIVLNGSQTDYPAGAYSSLQVNAADASDQVTVLATVVPTAIAGPSSQPSNFGPPGVLNVGNSGQLQGILQPLTVSGMLNATYDDSKDTIARHVALESGSLIYGLAPADIRNGLGNATLLMPAAGGNILDVSPDGGRGFKIVGNTPNGAVEAINIGSNALAFANNQYSLSLDEAGKGTDAVTIDDSADGTHRAINVGPGQSSNLAITGLGGSIDFQPSAVSSLVFRGGSGGDFFDVVLPGMSNAVVTLDSGTATDGFNISNVPAGVTVNIQGRGGRDNVYVYSGGSYGPMAGTIKLANPGGSASLTIDDSQDTSARNVTFDTFMLAGSTDTWERVIGLCPGEVDYRGADTAVSISGSGGADSVYTLLGTPSYPAVASSPELSINAWGPNSTFDVTGVGANATISFAEQGYNATATAAIDFSSGHVAAGAQISLYSYGGLMLSIHGQGPLDAFAVGQTQTILGTIGIQYNTLSALSLATGTFTINGLSGPRLDFDGTGTSAIWTGQAQVASLSIANGAHVSLPPTGLLYDLYAGTMDFSSGGELDVRNDTLRVDTNAGSATPQIVRAWIAGGYNNGGWNGTGIVSSSLSPGAALGYNAYLSGATIQPALVGDANLDGKVTLYDLMQLTRSFGRADAIWAQGDFNYDGRVDLSDFLALTRSFGKSFSPAAVTASAVSSASAQQQSSQSLTARRSRGLAKSVVG